MAGVELAELSRDELFSFMSSEMGARQWRESLQSRRDQARQEPKGYVEKLMAARRGKPETMDWRNYVQMRRQVHQASGKSRSKGYPAEPMRAKRPTGGLPKTSLHRDKT